MSAYVVCRMFLEWISIVTDSMMRLLSEEPLVCSNWFHKCVDTTHQSNRWQPVPGPNDTDPLYFPRAPWEWQLGLGGEENDILQTSGGPTGLTADLISTDPLRRSPALSFYLSFISLSLPVPRREHTWVDLFCGSWVEMPARPPVSRDRETERDVLGRWTNKSNEHKESWRRRSPK